MFRVPCSPTELFRPTPWIEAHVHIRPFWSSKERHTTCTLNKLQRSIHQLVAEELAAETTDGAIKAALSLPKALGGGKRVLDTT